MKLRLHTRYQNSAGQRVRIVLNLKNIPYEYVPVHSVSAAAYRAINPQALMPALECDGHIIAQSSAIIEFLEERFPSPSIFPEDPFLRAEVRAFSQHITADLHPLNNRRVRRYLQDRMQQDAEDIQAWYAHWIAVTFRSLETMLDRSQNTPRYCFDEKPGLAEACLVPQMDNARRFNCDISPYPRLREVDAACRKLAAFQLAAPESQPDYPGEI